MGQQQVKLPTSNHIVTLVLNKRNNLEIAVHACNQDRQLTLQYNQEYMFLEMPEEVQDEFHTMKNLFRNVSDSQGVCCTGGHGHYRVEFEKGKLILRKNNGKEMSILVNRIDDDSEEKMTIELEDKVVSLQDRLERQVVNKKKNDQVSGRMYRSDAAKSHTVSLEKHFFKLQNGFYLSLFNLNANIIQSIRQSALQPMIVTQLDLTGNNLTSSSLNQILSLKWDSLRKLWLDDNLLQNTNGLQTLTKLNQLSLTKNLLKFQAAEHLSKAKFNELTYLKISFLTFRQDQKCWQLLWSNDGKNLPNLQRLVIVHHKMLPQKIKNKYEAWKNIQNQQGKQRQLIYEIKDLAKISEQKISTLNKINSLSNYPQFQ